MQNFKKYLNESADTVSVEILNILDSSKNYSKSFLDAMKYVINVGGKRLRPILLLEVCKIFGVNYDQAIRVAICIELIHCYSLVHDDLPSMDDDSIRRGHPTCHIKYNEATAILVGDAFLTLAFEILSEKKTHPDAEVRCKLINELSRSSGLSGMVGGQKLDLEAESKKLKLSEIKNLQKLKTGELFRFSCVAGSILAKKGKQDFENLEKFAYKLGLAFQIQDDLLDVTGDESKTGKKLKKDLRRGKQTFISFMGVTRAKKSAEKLIEEALNIISNYGSDGENLKQITKIIINRSS
ncbi:MAG: farnesyl-diphosphate synthase [Rickettsiales bacterium]|nr:farnesyl-diphosphate synthase [Rickettsiales bacterium]